ncbi:MAG TPA: LptE family protein [Chitinophagales bacterium]|nr:LptE family protein [Chitinophagales bacterium]
MITNRTKTAEGKNIHFNKPFQFALNSCLGKARFAAFCFAVLISSLFTSCHIYSFTGASIDPTDSTFTIHFIVNQAPVVIPSLSQTLTDALKNKFLTSTNLALVQSNGDLEFSGAITGYQVNPVSAQANEIAALNRLTITVSIDFVNRKNEKQSWNSTFSRYADYNSSSDLASVQDQLIKQINEQLVEDIFNKAVVNW